MSSNINPGSDGYNRLYPVVGVNNSTQGFRNNFTSIFNNFTFAKQEIDILQSKKLDFNQPDSDVTGTSLPFVFDKNDPGAPIPVTLKIKPNLEMEGDYLQVPNYGTRTQKNGKLRYNRDNECLEISVGEPTQWLLLTSYKDSSTYILRNGDTVRGTLLFDGPTDMIQVIGDSRKNSTLTNTMPAFSFKDEPNSGLAYYDENKIALTVSKNSLVLIGKSKKNLSTIEATPKYNVANFSPYEEAFCNNEDTKNTKIHGQYRGYQRTHEYFIHKKDISKQIPGPLEIPLVTFKVTPDINYANSAIGYNFDFIYSGSSQTGQSFIISGLSVGSFMFDNNGNFVGIQKSPNVFMTKKKPIVVKHSCETDNVYDLDIDFRIEKIVNAVNIVAICTNKISEAAGLDFDITGKITIHYNSLGSIPVIINNMHD